MKRLLVVAVVLLLGALAVPLGGRTVLRKREQNPVLRGRILTERLGCTGCHQPFGGKEIPNPGSRWGSVPAFEGGSAVMYASNRTEIAEFIRDGAPRKWLAEATIRHRLETQRIRMPAWGTRLSEAQVTDLVEYVCAASDFDLPGNDNARAGREAARDAGCFGCHGVEGSGGVPNPGSLSGFIPGFAGRNFLDLVKDEAEFREWIRTGTSARLERNPLARAFWRRQAVAMPAFGPETLSEEDIARIWVWVQSVRAAAGATGG